jgi:hypothetical protein
MLASREASLASSGLKAAAGGKAAEAARCIELSTHSGHAEWRVEGVVDADAEANKPSLRRTA